MARREGVWLQCPKCADPVWVCDPEAVGGCTHPDAHPLKTYAMQKVVK